MYVGAFQMRSKFRNPRVFLMYALSRWETRQMGDLKWMPVGLLSRFALSHHLLSRSHPPHAMLHFVFILVKARGPCSAQTLEINKIASVNLFIYALDDITDARTPAHASQLELSENG